MSDTRVALVVTIVLALFASPLAVDAQQTGKVPRIGLIRPGSAPDPHVDAFLLGLRDIGYVEGKTIAIEYRWAQGKMERIPEFAEELVRLGVDVIVTTNLGAEVKRVTRTIPVVSPTMTDPVGDGLAASLTRPGGNITGLSNVNPELSAKRLELLKEMVPKVSRVAVLHAPRGTTGVRSTGVRATDAAARALGLHLQIFEVRSLADLETAFAAAKQARAGAVNILASGFFFTHRARIVEAARKTQLPAMYEHRAFTDAGGLVSYGPSFPELFRRAATYVDKILKGVKPADLPIEQPTKFEFVINMKTAKALGLAIPPSVLARANEVIE